ncbi:MAG: M81 family metallopeptidase [Hyphomicrobiales bacterium]|nr:M81 family metallopeptidase [Hyphomicrobiales bacterium]MCP5372315.1 M81 family metallopeptidase [Hyphomicrobiales bacterium]
MRIFIAGLGTETNSFSPVPTGHESFAETLLFHGDATRNTQHMFAQPLHEWRARAEADGAQVIEGLCAAAQPGGTTVRPVYEALRDELLANIRAALPLDVVLVNMHGSMVAEGYDDCEGDMLARIRSLVGPDVALGAELDLHCSITDAMLAAADALVTYKEYPHVDSRERAAELYAICTAKARGKAAPVMAKHDCRMVSAWWTTVEPTATLVRDMQAREGRDGILSVSFAHGFPWADVPDGAASVVVVADGDLGKAAAVAAEFGARIWAMRHQTAPVFETIDSALDKAADGRPGPLVLADVSDNAGGGAPSDSTFLLRAVLDRGLTDVVAGIYWDPVAVRFCVEAGEGARLDLRLGGKCGPVSGAPLDLEVRVMKILTDASQAFGTARNSMGTAVWLRLGDDIDIVANTLRTQTFHPDAYTQFGIDVAAKHLVLVKSSQHFRAGFGPLAREVLHVAGPGAITPDFAHIPFRKLTRPYWPRVEDPFAAES